jgi:hypothetical protein
MGRLTVPPVISGACRADDETLRLVIGRPVFEAVFADLAIRERDVCVRRGCSWSACGGAVGDQMCRTWSGFTAAAPTWPSHAGETSSARASAASRSGRP